MNVSIRLLIASILLLAGVRAVSLLVWQPQPPSGLDLRARLGLRDEGGLLDFAAIGVSDDAGARVWQVAWRDRDGVTTVLLPDQDGRWWGLVGTGGAGTSARERLAKIAEHFAGDVMEFVTYSESRNSFTAIPLGESGSVGSLSVAVWDPAAPVFITAGEDGAPGVRGQDDDGDGRVDTESELGSTGSDDQIIAPGDPGYPDAGEGLVFQGDDAEVGSAVRSRVISRGAMVDLKDDWEWPDRQSADVADGTGSATQEIWLRLNDADGSTLAELSLRLGGEPVSAESKRRGPNDGKLNESEGIRDGTH